jgi:hypothetical protein
VSEFEYELSTDDGRGGTRHIRLQRTSSGLMLEGQDLGGAVSEIFGEDFTEYEWSWSLPSDRIQVLADRVGAATLPDLDHRLQIVMSRSSLEIQKLFEEAGAVFWNRIGD